MAYSPPAANNVALELGSGGYSAPAASSVALQFPLIVPEIHIIGASNCSFVLSAIISSSTSIGGVSTTSFVSGATKGANASIGCATTFVPVHYNPHLTVAAGSTFDFIGGGILSSGASVSGLATVYFERYYEIPIVCYATFSPFAGGIVSDRFQSVSKAVGAFRAVYQAPSKFTLFGKGSCYFSGSNSAASLFSVPGAHVAEFSGAAIRSSDVIISGAAAPAFNARSVMASMFSSIGQSANNYAGSAGTEVAFYGSGGSAVAFSSAASSVSVNSVPADADTVYVLVINKQVVVHAV